MTINKDENGVGFDVFQEQFQRLVEAWREAGSYVQTSELARSPYARAQTVRYMMRLMVGLVTTGLEFDDELYPKLVRMFDMTNPHPNTNPDCTYFIARVSPDHVYRISGFAGTARVLEVQVMSGRFPAGPNHASLFTLSDLKGDRNGDIEIVLSAASQTGNWVKLPPTAAWIYVRQYYYDWNVEQPANLVIERIGASYPPAPVPAEVLKQRVDQIIAWIPTWHRYLIGKATNFSEAPADRLTFFKSSSGMDGLVYGKSYFNLAPDEAMLVEFDPPETPYWSFQVMNSLWETLAFDMNQSSLNGFQSRLDEDGIFRGVISVSDPGVHNWLDPVGNSSGLICLRVLRPSRDPVVSLRIVKLEKIREHLHRATANITREERSRILRMRMFGTERRHRQ